MEYIKIICYNFLYSLKGFLFFDYRVLVGVNLFFLSFTGLVELGYLMFVFVFDMFIILWVCLLFIVFFFGEIDIKLVWFGNIIICE